MKKYVFIIFFIAGCNTLKAPGNKSIKLAEGTLAENGMVVSAHELASQVGVDILKKGGNAFDAAIAVQFALAVVYPQAGNIGGGGFAVYRKNNGEIGTLDFREKAPENSTRDMYLDKDKNPVQDLSLKGVLAVGIPGTVNGMVKLHEKLGTLPFEDLVAPAILLAKDGFAISKSLASRLNGSREDFIKYNREKTFAVNPQPWKENEVIKNKDLATTLEKIAKEGNNGFYKGKIAGLIVDEMKAQNGIITLKDLENYQAVWRTALTGNYRGYRIITMPPPSSGGVALLQLLAGSESYKINKFGFNTAKTVHLMTELERRVYADRATYMGDPDFIDIPYSLLLNKNYMRRRMQSFSWETKTPSSEVKEGKVEIIESMETTHFSIVDKDRNAIAITTTLNGYFGSKVVVKGAGFFLNNEMDDFSKKAGVPNQFGLVGGDANAIEPNKRMLSSMTPTIVDKNGKLFMVLGTPGGSTIITIVYQTILNVIDHQMTMQEAINAKKTHHQWQPDEISYEKNGIDSLNLTRLKIMKHKISTSGQIGKVDAVLVKKNGMLEGGADYTRGNDKAIGY